MTPAQILVQLSGADVDGKLRRMCERARVPLDDVLRRCRQPEVVKVRHAYWRWLHKEQGYSQSRIARWWGVDSTTVCVAVRKEQA